MERYADKLKELESKHKKLKEKLCTLILNIREDQPEGMFAKSQYATRLGDIHKSILYRINSIHWHVYNLCHHHSACEKKLYDNSNSNDTLSLCSLYSSYIFDDFIFNLISLHDYFGGLFYIAFANETQLKKTWRSLAIDYAQIKIMIFTTASWQKIFVTIIEHGFKKLKILEPVLSIMGLKKVTLK